MNETLMDKAKMTVGAAIAVMVLALVMICGFIAVVIHDASQRERDRIAARIYFCAEIETLKTVHRADVNERIGDTRRSIKETERYLRENPSGDLAPAIRRGLPALVKRRDNLEQRRLDLAPVNCSKFKNLGDLPRVETVVEEMEEG